MAGAGFKTFNTGDVLLASEVNTYLMQQTVMVFDDATARTSALGANVAEGMFSYLKDTNLTYRYDGSAWLSDAGTTSPLTTKGDIWGYSTTDARIPVGANGTVLTADSAETLGVKWAAAGGGGKLLQLVSTQITSYVSISTTTNTDTNISASITPSSATSKVLVVITACVRAHTNTSANGARVGARILRGATQIVNFEEARFTQVVPSTDVFSYVTVQYLDSPNTTSATTYKLQGRVEATADGQYAEFQLSSSPSTITLYEIGA